MNPSRQFKTAVLSLILLVGIGTVGFMYIEGMNILDALYMTVITLTTVGFREVEPLDAYGKIFTMVVVIVGVTLAFWALGSLVDLTVSERLWRSLRRRKMEKEISKMRNHHIICGYGRMGQQIAKDFAQHNVPFVVVELNQEQLPKLDAGEIAYIEGNASDDKTLIAAGIKHAVGLVTVSPSDQDNVFITLTARVLNPKLHIVARSILEENEDKLKRAGADVVLSPYVMGGRRMATAVLRPHVIEFLDTAMHSENLDLQIEEVRIKEAAKFANKTIRDSGIRQKSGCIILAIKDGGGQFANNPSPDRVLKPGEIMIVMGSPTQLTALEKMTGRAEA
ncbi:MAG: potassium channel protein [Armatimonadota bacterium]|nr:potassium channel protein [Armatimonadota bacterium]